MEVFVLHIKPATIEEAQAKALPILVAGFRRRGAQRTAQERAVRAEVKLVRDDQHCQEPRVCAL